MKICSRCGDEFVETREPLTIYRDKRSRVSDKICQTCREKQAPAINQTDSWQYLHKGYGYRLEAGFNLLHEHES